MATKTKTKKLQPESEAWHVRQERRTGYHTHVCDRCGASWLDRNQTWMESFFGLGGDHKCQRCGKIVTLKYRGGAISP